MNSLLSVASALVLLLQSFGFAGGLLQGQGLYSNDSSTDISEFVSNDTLGYIASFSPFILDGFKDMNSYSQMRSIYYDINGFEEVNDKDFIRMSNERGEYKFITLENKIKAFLVSKPILYKSSIAATIRYGTFNEPPGMKGLSVLLKNLIISKVKFKANRRTNPLYFKDLENAINGRIYGHGTEISIEVFNEDFVDILHTLSEALASPLDADFRTLSSLRRDTREEIKGGCISMDSLKGVLVESYFCRKSGYKYLDALTDSKASSKDEFKRGYRITTASALDEEQSEEYIHLNRVLNEHFNKYYCSNLMTLVIVSNENMHDLQTLVKTFFGRIRSSNLSMAELAKMYSFGDNPYLRHVGKVVAIKQDSINLELKLVFPIPYQKNLWRYKLTEYISFYLDDDSEEGLAGILRSRGWISSISSGCETKDTGYSNFVVIVNLQKEGVRHILQIIEALLSTIKLISKQGLSEEALSHIRVESSFELKNLNLGLDTDHAGFILRSYIGSGCFPKDVLAAPLIMDRIEGKYIRKLLNFIRADNMIISYPVKSLGNGASYYLRLSDSFLGSYLFTFEKAMFRLFNGVSTLFLRSLFRVTPERVVSRFPKKLYYSEERVPQYLQRKLSYIDERIALEELKVQLFDPSAEGYSQIYTDDRHSSMLAPVSLRDALDGEQFERRSSPPASESRDVGDEAASESESAPSDLTDRTLYDGSFTNAEEAEPGLDQGDPNDGLCDKGASGEHGGDHAHYVQDLDYQTESAESQPNVDSVFYMPLQNRVPALSVVFDITIPLEFNSTDLLLLNMNKQKLVLLSFLFKHSMSLSMASSNFDGVIKIENYTDFMNINVLPGLQISWDGNAKYFDEFFVKLVYNLTHLRTALTSSYFEQSIAELKRLLGKLTYASNEEYSLMQLLQIMHLESVKSWALENDAKYLSFKDVKLFGKILLRYGEVHGVVIGNCLPSQIYSRIRRFIRLIRPSARVLNSYEQTGSGKISMIFGTQGDEWISDQDLTDEMIRMNYMGSIFRDAEDKGSASGSKFIDMSLLPSIFRKNYFFKRRVSSSDPFNTVLLYVHLGRANEENRVLLDLLELVDFQKVLNSFIANKKSLRYSSIQIGSLFTSPEVASFQIRVTFLSNKIVQMVNVILEFFDVYFLNPEKVFSERDFLSLRSMLLSNFQKDSLSTSKLAQTHYERIIRANLAPDWQLKETNALKSLCFGRFLELWQSFKAAPTILIAIQSNRNQDGHSNQLPEFVPEGYTRLKSIYQFKDTFR